MSEAVAAEAEEEDEGAEVMAVESIPWIMAAAAAVGVGAVPKCISSSRSSRKGAAPGAA